MPADAKGPNVGYVRTEVNREFPKWEIVDDCIAGEIAVKKKGEKYLPKPETNSDPAKNQKQYEKYKLRAVFFPVTGRTLSGLNGQVFSKPVAHEIPEKLENLLENIDGAGTTLEQQSKQTLNSVLKRGRAGLLSDFPTVADGDVVTRDDLEKGRIRPRIIFYHPAQIINWRETTVGGETLLTKLVLREEKIVEDDGFEFKTSPRWRVLELTETGVQVTLWKQENDEVKDGNVRYVKDGETVQLIGAGQKQLEKIPFVFVGATNNDSTVDESPLYPLASLNVAHYRNSADHEQSLFLVGQATPVFTGLTDDWMKKHIKGKVTLGSSNAVGLPKDADAKLLQADPNTMPMEGMKHKEDQMKAIGAKLIEPRTVERTATDAEIEETSEASVLSAVAKNVSAAYRKAVYYASLFIGDFSEDDFSIDLNSDFQVMGLSATERKEVVEAWQGGVLTWEEVREVYRRKGIATKPDDEAKEVIAQGLAEFNGDASSDE